jgi:hypothetical protein
VGGEVSPDLPQFYSYKTLNPISNQKLSTPRLFTLNYGANWFPQDGGLSLPPVPVPVSFETDVYLTIQFSDYDQSVTNPTTARRTFVNIRLPNRLSWDADNFTFYFNQPMRSFDLLNNFPVRNIIPSGGYPYPDFRDTQTDNLRSKISNIDLDKLLNGGSQIAVALCIDESNITVANGGTFMAYMTAQGKIKMNLTYDFQYYAPLVSLK